MARTEIGGGRQLGETTGSTSQTTQATQHSQTASCAGGNLAATSEITLDWSEVPNYGVRDNLCHI